ncbi:MAG: ATP synthase F0 subunit B [Clostridiales bacterium]|nr:ATP synthase F0 subunit B [Clostridiales bacterium]
MTFKLKKTKLFGALIAALCTLAVAFAVVLFMPRGAASADEPETEGYTVTWEYKTSEDGQWQTFVNGRTLFTYERDEDNRDKDYSALVRAKIDLGADTDAEEIYYSADGSSANGLYLSYAGTLYKGTTDEIALTTLVNAAEYTITINGEFADGVTVADADRVITIKIAPRVFDMREIDLVDYSGGTESDRLWMLNDGSELIDRATYFDPDAAFNSEYGAKVTTGELYNAYVRYTGKPHTIVLNDDYEINDNAFKNYKYAIKSIEYDNGSSTGYANTVNKITTTVTITLTANWTFDDSKTAVVLTKDWYIVTINNALRTLDGDESTTVEGWMFGATAPELSLRPEHGDHAIFTLGKDNAVLGRFAVKYSGNGSNTVLEYYDVKSDDNGYVIDTDKALDDDYPTELFAELRVGAYTLNVSVPSYSADLDHEHWWDDAVEEATSVVFYPISRTYHFTVACYEANAENVSVNEDDDKDIIIKLLTDHVEYNGLDNNVPDAVVTFRGVELVHNVDYELISSNVKVGKASFMFVGKGSFAGTVLFDDMYDIDPAVNSWKDVPSIMYWTYGNYDKNMNLINGMPTYLDNPNDLSFRITMDMMGEIPASDALASFILTDGIVSDDVEKALSALNVGTYYLFAAVKESTNYKALAPRGIAFKVFKASNVWEAAPTIDTWAEGSYKADNLPTCKPLHGTATIVITDSKNNVVYSTVTGVNKLSAAKAGTYTLTATVVGSNDYDGLVYSSVFTVHEKPGIPVWAVLVIVFGVLALLAIVVIILLKTKVLRILTEKIAVSIRTQAAVDATVASVRAAKKNDEYKRQLAEAKEKREAEALRQEKREARKAKAALEKAMPVEQKIAALEEKARKAEARAEKARVRAELMQQRVERMKEATAEPQPTPEPTEQPATAPTAEAAATDNGTSSEE